MTETSAMHYFWHIWVHINLESKFYGYNVVRWVLFQVIYERCLFLAFNKHFEIYVYVLKTTQTVINQAALL